MDFRWALAALALGVPALRAQSGCNNTPAYSPCEMVFELNQQEAAANPNPYASVDLRVEFRSPQQRTLALPGYWDGGRRMVVRFAPTEGGQWDYLVNSNIAAWDGKTGNFTAAASDSKGFIQPANLHHWAYSGNARAGSTRATCGWASSEPRFALPGRRRLPRRWRTRAPPGNSTTSAASCWPAPSAAVPVPTAAPTWHYFQRLDQRVRYLNQKGLIADLVLARRRRHAAPSLPHLRSSGASSRATWWAATPP